MIARIWRNWRLSVCIGCVSLALMLLYAGSYKALGQIPLVSQTAGSTVGFSESSYTVGQGQTAEIVVTLNTPSQQEVSIYYETSDGTAKAGVDYSETSGTLTIPAGALSQKFTVPTKANRNGSPLRTLNISLSSPSNARIGSSTAIMYVANGPDGLTCQ